MKKPLIILLFLAGMVCLVVSYGSAESPSVSTKIEPALSEKLKTLSPEAMARVIITLSEQPYGVIKEDLEESRRFQLEAVRNRVELEKQRQGAAPVDDPVKEMKSLNSAIRVEAYRKAKTQVEKGQMAVVSHLEAAAGKVNYRYIVVNSLSALVPAKEIEGLSSLPEVSRISEDAVMGADLSASVLSIYGDTWWNNGLSGGIYNAGILDSGMKGTHPAFSGKTVPGNTFHVTGSADACYEDDPDSADDLAGHGTHVGGIVMSQGAAECPLCLGVAKGLDKTFNLKAGWRSRCTGGASMYWSDAMAAIDWAESQPDAPDVYNLSYSGPALSDDSDLARFLDAVVSMNGKPLALSAGNSGPNNPGFNDPAAAYNSLTVANMDDGNTVDRSDDRIHNSSSRGPTASGRKKPDLAAPGSRIGSANHWWEVDYDFVDRTGTSMAAPHVAGAFILLQDYTGSGVAQALRQKALLINSADSWSDRGTADNPADDGPVAGKHWDRTYGWGYLNLDGAYLHRSYTLPGSLTTADRYRLYKGRMSQGDKATAVWNRRVLYNGANSPAAWSALSDIDLQLRREHDNALLDSSESRIDNVEQVAPLMESGKEGVVLKAALAGAVDAAASETYALAASGSFSPASFDVRLIRTAVPVVCPGRTFSLVQTVVNHGDIYSHNHSVRLATPAGWTQNAPNPMTLGSLQPNGRGSIIWSVTSPSSGSRLFGVSGISDSYGEIIAIPEGVFSVGVKAPGFTDVSCEHPFYGWIERLKEKGITAGCSPTRYCPDSAAARKQAAVIIIRAMNQEPSSAPFDAYFRDIADDTYAPYINRMYELKITGGCDTGLFCPENPITRGEAAVFISEAKGLPPFAPANPAFVDVPSSHQFHSHIERLWRNAVTSGCSASQYCPESVLSRGELAVFVIQAWP